MCSTVIHKGFVDRALIGDLPKPLLLLCGERPRNHDIEANDINIALRRLVEVITAKVSNAAGSP
jgi:hypothetical protein